MGNPAATTPDSASGGFLDKITSMATSAVANATASSTEDASENGEKPGFFSKMFSGAKSMVGNWSDSRAHWWINGILNIAQPFNKNVALAEAGEDFVTALTKGDTNGMFSAALDGAVTYGLDWAFDGIANWLGKCPLIGGLLEGIFRAFTFWIPATIGELVQATYDGLRLWLIK